MNWKLATGLGLLVLAAGCGGEKPESTPAADADKPAAEAERPASKTGGGITVDVASMVWETDEDEPFIGDPNAKKGGTFKSYMSAYPLTFRIVGPDSNDEFAAWKRAWTQDFALVRRHPTTDQFIPCLATHWKVMEDNRTIYFKLDPDARWSDGEKITADDYVFTNEMMRSPHIVDPFYNNYFEERIESVEAVEPYVVKVVGAKPSWRPLYDYNIWPMPRHFHTLDADWVKNYNLKAEPGAGPYVLSDAVEGQRLAYKRLPDWWGANKRYFQGMYNVDNIEIIIIPDVDRAFDFLKKGDISYYTVTSAKRWAEEMDFPAYQKGWVHRKRLFVEYPQGLYGLAMNLERPLFQNKDFRKAIQYAFDFDEINQNLMYNAYYRIVSSFEGTEYENPDLKPYGFDQNKCREHLAAAGFTKRGGDGIFARDDGTRAAFTFTYGSPSLTRHFTVVKQKFLKLGIDMTLQVLEPGTAFQRGLEREYEVTMMSRTTGFFPDPHQYYHSEFTKTKNNNNIWSYGAARTDSLIDVYRFDMDFDRRFQAMREIDAIIQDEAFYVPFWQSPFVRFIYWDYLQFPSFFWPKRFEQSTDWQVFWVDQDRLAALEVAMKENRDLGVDQSVDQDPYGVKAAAEKATSQLGN